jgi:voltage-dependent potassium channel beta subunit
MTVVLTSSTPLRGKDAFTNHHEPCWPNSYADGQSEIVMGKAIKKFGWNRNDLVISTKVNIFAHPQYLRSWPSQLNWGGANGEVLINNHGLSRKHVIEGLKASLKRLDMEYVDIVYAHRPDRLTPMEETVRAFNYVIENGMAFYWGTSQWSADEIVEAHGIAKQLGLVAPIVEQPGYNILDRSKVEGEFQRLYSRFGLGLTTYSPMKMGILSGKYNDASNEPPPGSRIAESNGNFGEFMRKTYRSPRLQGDIAKVATLKVSPVAASACWYNLTQKQPIADKLGVPQSQLALAWCLKNPNVAAVISGASKPEQIVENVKCLQLLEKLTPDIMQEIDDIIGNKPAIDAARQD